VPLPISAHVKMAIIDCYFHEYSSRDRIAKKVHKGSGTVSREIEKFENELKKSIGAASIQFVNLIDGEEIKIDNLEFKIKL